MSENNYHFVSHWRVRGTVQEVTDIFRFGRDLPLWWPAVYLNAQEMDPGDADGKGYTVDLYSKGWLPYTIRWTARSVETRHPYGFTIETSGDFVGRGKWTFEQDAEYTDISYDWQIQADKPLLRYGAFLLNPLYEFNHRWAMNMGEKSLQLELERRRAQTEAERSRIPQPPPPTTTSPLPALLGLVGILGLLAAVIYLVSGMVR